MSKIMELAYAYGNALATSATDTKDARAALEAEVDRVVAERDELVGFLARCRDSVPEGYATDFVSGAIACPEDVAPYVAAAFSELVAENERLRSSRGEAAEKALGYAGKYSDIVQAITDPENQPSQFGTVTLAMYEAAVAERDEQCRLNGMGAEREYVLLGKVAQLERERDALRTAAQAGLEAIRKSMQGNLDFTEAMQVFTQLQAALKGTS